MRPGYIIDYIKYFLLLIGLQLLIFKNMVVFNMATCLIYVAFILLMPIETSSFILLLIGFGIGIFIDTFFDTSGINAFACVCIAYFRKYFINALTPAGGYDAGSLTSLSYMGFPWFIRYSAPLILIHHFLYFMLEAWSFKYLGDVLLQTITSSVFTLLVLILLQLIIDRRKN